MADTHQKILGQVQLQDADGNNIGSTDGALDVHVTSGDITIDNATIFVDLDAFSATPDSVLSVGSLDGSKLATRKVMKVLSDGTVVIDGSAVTQPISATTLPLPTGAATESKQDAANTSLASIDTKLTSPIIVTGPLTDIQLRASAVAMSAASLPLPTGAATSALQTQPGIDIGDVTVNNANGAAAVNVQDGGNSITVDGTVSASQSGTWNINNISGTINLPTGASTETTLSALSTKIPANLTVTSTRLLIDGSGVTQPVSITGTIPVSGTITANQGTTPWQTSELDITISHTFTTPSDTFTVDCTSMSTLKLQFVGTWTDTIAMTQSVDGTNYDAFLFAFSGFDNNVRNLFDAEGIFVADVTGLKTVKFISGSSFSGSVLLTTTTSTKTTVLSNIFGTLAISGPTRIYSSDDSAINIGQQTMSASLPVVIASNQSDVPVSGTFWQATQPVSGPLTDIQLRAVPMPISGTVTATTGGLTDAQLRATPVPISGTITATTGGLTDTQLRASAVPISAAALPLPSGAATSGLQTQPGVDIGDVTVNNASGGGAVNVQDGGNSLTVDGSVTVTQATGTNLHTVVDSGTISTITNVVHVDDNGGSLTVDNNGTFAVQATLTAETTKVIGTVNLSAAQTLANVTTLGTITNVVHIDDNSGSLTVDNAGTFAVQATVAASAANIAKAEDTAFADLDVGVPAMAIRKATPVNTSNTDGDYEMLQISVGRLWTSATIDAALPAGSNTIGALTANQSINNAQIAGVATTTGNGVTGTGSQRVTIASDNTAFSVNATPPTLTKGTQGATGYSVQNLKDAGRTSLIFYAVAAAAGVTTVETAITLTKASGTAATTTGTSFVVTNGKRFRITSISVATRANAVATAQTTTFNLRINTAGAVITTSTPLVFSARSATAATASAWDRFMLEIPDGYEILGDGTLQFGVTANATYAVNAPTWDITIVGFEY